MTADHEPSREAWTATELMAMEFPEPRWAVPGIVAEGVTLLAGAPKVGKSWLALNISTAVATPGARALGKVPTEAGDVLYLALEDNPRRLKSRLTKVLADQRAPERLTFTVQCEPLNGGGIDRISSWLEKHPDARLVIVDVFARVRGAVPPNMASYDADYLAMGSLRRLADQHQVAILVVHHTRKAAADDFLDTVSGTNGLAGAADAVLVLRRTRGKADGILHVTGRDVPEDEHALTFDGQYGIWSMLDGPASDYALGDTRRTILDHLRAVGSATPRQIAESTGINYDLAKKTAKRMADDGQLDTNGQGHYFPPLSPVPPVSAVPDPETSEAGETQIERRPGAETGET